MNTDAINALCAEARQQAVDSPATAQVYALLALVEVLKDYAELFRPAKVPDHMLKPFPEPDWRGR